MNIRTRRRLAAGSLLTSAAVVAGVLAAAPASAGTLALSPNTAFNNATVAVDINGDDSMPELGGTLTLTRVGGGTGESGENTPNPVDPAPAMVDLTDGAGTGVGNDGPANAGLYNATYTDDGPAVPPGRGTDSCTSCFTVLAPGAVAISSLSPSAINQGGVANVTVTGNNFERGSVLEVLLPGTSTIDPNVTENGQPLQANGNAQADPVTTRTSLVRRFTITGAAQTGPRDVRVTNLDGTTASCTACFTVNGAPIASINPTGATNSPTQTPALKSITFSANTGSSFKPSSGPNGVPSLAFIGNGGGTGTGGSSTKTALSIPGQNAVFAADGSSVTADYDLKNAAPGDDAYAATITQADGSSNTCTSAACRFDVLQPAVATITSLDSDTGTAGNQNTLKGGETKVFTVTGTNFSRGIILNAGAGVTNTAVEFVNETTLRATLAAAGSATGGPRDVTGTTTDAKTGPACTGCLVVEATATASPTATATATSTATATATATATSTATGTASPTPTGTATNGRYVALDTPTRVLDSRPAPDNKGTSPAKKLGTVPVDLSGVLGGTTAQSVVLNLTVVSPDGSGNAVVHAQGAAIPGTSNINFIKGQIQANQVVTLINQANKQAAVTVRGSATHLIVDMVGYFTSANVTTAARTVLQTPKRVAGAQDGANIADGGVLSLTLGANDVPAGSTSAILNITVTRASQPSGFVVAYPGGTSQPATSNVNFTRLDNQGKVAVQANEAIVRLGTGADAGKINLKISRGTARVIVDVVGGLVSGNGDVYTGLTPDRFVDSRPGSTNEGTSATRKTGAVAITLPSSVPAGATGVVLNVTAVDAAAGNSGFVVAYPTGTTKPATSNVNWRAGSTQANEVIVRIGSNRQVTLEVDGASKGSGTHLVVDLVGYVAGTGAASTATPTSTSTATGTATPTATSSATATPTATATATATSSATATPTATGSATATPTATGTRAP